MQSAKSVHSTKCWTTMESFVDADDCNLSQMTSKSRKFDYTARKRQDSQTLYRTCTQTLHSTRNRASESFCAAKIPHQWTQQNNFKYKLQMCSLHTLCRSKHSTCHGSPPCLPFPDRVYPVFFCEQRSQLFSTLLYRRCRRTD